MLQSYKICKLRCKINVLIKRNKDCLWLDYALGLCPDFSWSGESFIFSPNFLPLKITVTRKCKS